MPTDELKKLAEQLSDLSHNEDAIAAVREFSKSLGSTDARLAVFNATLALVRPPILQQEIEALGFSGDSFTVLQGDVVATESAFHLGERIVNYPKYVVLNSSCDLVPERRKYAALLRVVEISESEENAKSKVNLLLKFKLSDSMYLPVMPHDSADVICNMVQFDGICQIRMSDLLLASRMASLSLVGWHIFASFSRMVLSRAGEEEVRMRRDIEDLAEQESLGFPDPTPATQA